MKRFYTFIILVFACVFTLSSQEISEKNYERAVSFMYNNYNNKTAFNLFTTVHWFNDESGIWFVDYDANSKTYKTVDFKTKKVSQIFNQDKLATALSKITKTEVKSNQLSVSNIQKTKNKEELQFSFNQADYLLNLKTYDVKELTKPEREKRNPFERKSPDGNWIAFTKNYNLYIKSTKDNTEYQLSFDGKKGYEYATWYGWGDMIEGENGERPKRFSVNWSPDSKWLNANIVDTRNAEKMYLLDWSIDSLYKPKLLSYYRGSPGDKNMVKQTPVFFNISTKKEVKTNLPTGTHINSVSIRWTDKPGIALASYPERGFLKEVVKQINLNNNTEKTLIEEKSNTGIDNFTYRLLDKSNKIVFLSERSGWRQLYLLDIKTAKITPLTNGKYYVNSIEYFNDKENEIYFLASGKEENNNPYHQQLYKVNFKGKVTLLTPENTHHIINFSKNGKYVVDNYSTIQKPTKTVLREAKTGKIITKLTEADVTNPAAKGWRAPEVFQLVAKDGKTTIYGAFWKPTDFDSSKSYPIIDATYTGPHTQVFPKSFNRAFDNQSLAELGFIVVRIDGLGTSGRSKEFQDHSYKNMGNNLEDHVLAIKHLAKKYSWINGNKVGIFGHSAGGYDTGRAMLAFPDFYKVGVASSADHDFRMEKAWWPEMYQGWPVDETYEAVSNITNAKNLKGKLLLTHGGIDENVNPSVTFKLAEALIKADKQFDLLILPSQHHGYTGKHRLYFIKKRWNYFVEHLLGAKPIWKFNWE